MKKTLSLIIAMAMAVSVFALAASAATLVGYVDKDGNRYEVDDERLVDITGDGARIATTVKTQVIDYYVDGTEIVGYVGADGTEYAVENVIIIDGEAKIIVKTETAKTYDDPNDGSETFFEDGEEIWETVPDPDNPVVTGLDFSKPIYKYVPKYKYVSYTEEIRTARESTAEGEAWWYVLDENDNKTYHTVEEKMPNNNFFHCPGNVHMQVTDEQITGMEYVKVWSVAQQKEAWHLITDEFACPEIKSNGQPCGRTDWITYSNISHSNNGKGSDTNFQLTHFESVTVYDVETVKKWHWVQDGELKILIGFEKKTVPGEKLEFKGYTQVPYWFIQVNEYDVVTPVYNQVPVYKTETETVYIDVTPIYEEDPGPGPNPNPGPTPTPDPTPTTPVVVIIDPPATPESVENFFEEPVIIEDDETPRAELEFPEPVVIEEDETPRSVIEFGEGNPSTGASAFAGFLAPIAIAAAAAITVAAKTKKKS